MTDEQLKAALKVALDAWEEAKRQGEEDWA